MQNDVLHMVDLPDFVIRFFQKRADAGDLKELHRWLEEDMEHQRLFDWLPRKWTALESIMVIRPGTNFSPMSSNKKKSLPKKIRSHFNGGCFFRQQRLSQLHLWLGLLPCIFLIQTESQQRHRLPNILFPMGQDPW